MEAPQVACPGSSRLTPCRFGLPPCLCGHPNSASPILELALAVGAACVPGGAGASSAEEATGQENLFFFFLIYFSPLIYKAFGSFLMPRGISGEVPGEGRLWAATWQRFSRPARALLRTWFQF